MKTVYREKRYYCGEYLDVYIYPTYRQGRSRGKRSKPTSAAQAKLNQRHREEKLVRLLHANFTPDDLEIHLTYQQQPESPEEAQRLLRNYIRRVQRARKKQGLPPLKYIAVTEKGSKNGRYHHHVTLSGGMDRDELEKLWGLGTRTPAVCSSRRAALPGSVTTSSRARSMLEHGTPRKTLSTRSRKHGTGVSPASAPRSSPATRPTTPSMKGSIRAISSRMLAHGTTT